MEFNLRGSASCTFSLEQSGDKMDGRSKGTRRRECEGATSFLYRPSLLISLICLCFLFIIRYFSKVVSVFFFVHFHASATAGPYQLVRVRLAPNDLTVHLITAIKLFIHQSRPD